MKLSRYPISFLLAFLVLACLIPPAAAQSDYAGWIEEIHGQAYWRPRTGGKQVRLDVRADQYRRLHVGEALRCGHAATLQLRIYGSLRPVTEKSGWYRIPEGREVPQIPPYGTPGGKQASIGPGDAFAAQETMNALSQRAWGVLGALIGGIAGGGKGAAIGEAAGASRRVIFSPTDGGYVLADDVVFRWAPSPQLRVLTLAIEDSHGNLLWREEGVAGTAGEFASESARKVLRKYRDEKRSDQLLFVLVRETGSRDSVKFSVFSLDGEQVVRNELARWDGQQTVLRHVGRARVFSESGMTFEAVQEYEAALASAPESYALSEATTRARRHAGIWQVPEAAAGAPASEKPPKLN